MDYGSPLPWSHSWQCIWSFFMSLRSLLGPVLTIVAGCFTLNTAHGQVPVTHTWALTTGGSWATATNWAPPGVPNAAGDSVIFPPTNTANRAITLDSGSAGFTIGSLLFDQTGTGTFT